MLSKLCAIAKNTFTETLRQPVYAVIIIAALLLFFLSPSITMFTLDEDIKLLREIGLSTLFLSGLFIAIFAASSAVTEEIETKTIVTVLTKPVGRALFIIGKFLGVAAAVILAHYLCTLAFLMMMRHGVIESTADTHDRTVIGAVAVVVVVTFLLTAFLNYSYDWKFTSTAIVLGTILTTLSIIFLTFIDRDWQFNPAKNQISIFDIYASILLLLGLLTLAALAVMFSTRFNIVVTLICCVGVFLLGLINDYLFGRFAIQHIWARIGRAVLPNLQVFWISDAIYEGSEVPAKYILIGAGYALCYTAGVICLAIALFQRRQVG